MALPNLPVQGQNPWYTPRTDWDIAVKTELEGRLSTAQLGQAYSRKFTVDVRDFGVTMNGTTDDTIAFQAASTYAATGKGDLYIPPGTLRITGAVDVWNNLTCDGTVLIDSNTATVRIQRSLVPIAIVNTGLTGLVEGSTLIGGLGGRTGTLHIYSTEHLIERNNGVGQYYEKREMVEVLKADGTVSPPIDNTIASNTSVVVCNLYPAEAPIEINRLRCRPGAAVTVDKTAGFLEINRSNVTVNDMDVVNDSGKALINGVVVRTSSYIIFNRGVVSGFTDSGSGYGIATYDTVYTEYRNVSVTQCRHALSGRYNKARTVNGGVYEGGLDDHWVSGFTVRGVKSTVLSSGTHLAVCGKNVLVYDSDFYGGRNIIGIRNDAPDMAGDLILQGGSWAPSTGQGSLWAIGYSTSSLPYFDYGRIVRSPRRAIVRGIRYTTPGDQSVRFVNIAGLRFPHEYWKSIEVSQISIDAGSACAILAERDTVNHAADTVGMAMSVSNINFKSPGDSVYVSNVQDVEAGPAFTLAVDRCEEVYIRIPEAGVSTVSVRNSKLKLFYRSATSAIATPAPPQILLETCLLDATTFNGRLPFDSRNNTWRGALTSTTITMDARVKSRNGDVVEIGATGATTRAEGYRDPAFYTS